MYAFLVEGVLVILANSLGFVSEINPCIYSSIVCGCVWVSFSQRKPLDEGNKSRSLSEKTKSRPSIWIYLLRARLEREKKIIIFGMGKKANHENRQNLERSIFDI